MITTLCLLIFAVYTSSFIRDSDCPGYEFNGYEYAGQAIGGDCYYPSPAALSWSNARDVCESVIGGNLMSIHDRIQNELCLDLLDENQWIGLNDLENEDAYEWTDGSDYFFSSWAEGEPNDRNGEDCVELRDNGEWNDNKCYLKRRFICLLEGDHYTYFFENDNFDQGAPGEYDGLFGVAQPTTCCPNVEECGFEHNTINSVVVPRDYYLVLFDDFDCHSDTDHQYTLVQGPVSISKLGKLYNDLSSYRLEKRAFVDYPEAYKYNDFENFAFYISGYCRDLRYCFDYIESFNNDISSLKIPAGWAVHFYSGTNYGGLKLVINGPIEIPKLKEYNSFFDDNIGSIKLKRANNAVLVIEKILFDDAIRLSEEQEILESITVNNPTSNVQEYTMTNTYSQSQETNWFAEQSVTSSYNFEIGVTTEFSAGGIFGEVSAGLSFTSSWGGESTQSSGTGGSESHTEERSYEFVCSANSNTRTTCDITQSRGTFKVPYIGKIVFTYPTGEIGEREWNGMIKTTVAGEAYLDYEEEDLLCPSGNERNGYCYDVIQGNTYTYNVAMAECYFAEKTIAYPRDQAENHYIHSLCDYKSMWLGGNVNSNGLPSWMKDGDEEYTRYEDGIDSSKFGNDDFFLLMEERSDDLGYWVLENKNEKSADCIVCMWKCEREEE